MEALKVVAEGLTTSFRYPHFMQGIQPTFEMPPPATVYGHISSVLGEWFDPTGVRFAVHFSFEARFEDIEHTHVLTSATGKLKGTDVPKVLEGAVNPFTRALLFKPRLVLYLNRPEWAEAFRSPRYPVILGRSQDLFTYTEVDVVNLYQSDHAYFEHTLAPYSFALKTARGVVVLMPRFLDYENRRFPAFSQFVVLHRRVHSHEFLRYEGEPSLPFWVDPVSAEINGDKLGLIFHSWIEDDEDFAWVAQST
ncbi:MAG: CRISPR-associated protein Cas5 [Actinobacteria bacterium]|nr:CRISPR-associated protein Cas5 [Actinomycetota bacterium]